MNDKMLFIFDVDGTLIDTETHQIPLSTITALQQLHKQGHLLGISTGRSLPSLKNGGFASLIDWDFFLCNNGQAIFNKKQEILHLACIPQASVEKCMQVAHAQQNPILIIHGEGEYLTAAPNELVYQALDFFKELVPEVKPYDGQPVIMMIAYGPLQYDYASYHEIDGIHIIPGLSTYADIVLKDYHKYKGIQYLLKHLQMDSYIAFGDSLNDVEMLTHAAIGIAMGNAHEDVKAIADYVTTKVSEDGILQALTSLHFL